MDNIPSLDDLLNYEDECKYPDLIISDYFKIDNNNKNDKQQSQERKINQETNENFQNQETEQGTDENFQDQETEQGTDKEFQEQETEQGTDENFQDQETEQGTDKNFQNKEIEQGTDKEFQNQEMEQGTDKEFQEQEIDEQQKEKDENNFDDLMDNYDKENSFSNKTNENKNSERISDKLSDINTTKIYKVFRRLVSLNYEKYQKGTYKYNKKEIVKHYLTNQKFRIIDDLESPTFKPDVYVFDLSPSNNESLEMYVNAISSVAIKNSLIYLTYNNRILRKLIIKKENSREIDVSKVVNSQIKKYDNFDCIIFSEYRSLYEELRNIKDRKIYIFSDFDIISDISSLSQENRDIVWFSTERNNRGGLNYDNYFYREYPSSYKGYYVDIYGIDDIERFVFDKNKNKYRKRLI